MAGGSEEAGTIDVMDGATVEAEALGPPGLPVEHGDPGQDPPVLQGDRVLMPVIEESVAATPHPGEDAALAVGISERFHQS
jgi:hypothetical protein